MWTYPLLLLNAKVPHTEVVILLHDDKEVFGELILRAACKNAASQMTKLWGNELTSSNRCGWLANGKLKWGDGHERTWPVAQAIQSEIPHKCTAKIHRDHLSLTVKTFWLLMYSPRVAMLVSLQCWTKAGQSSATTQDYWRLWDDHLCTIRLKFATIFTAVSRMYATVHFIPKGTPRISEDLLCFNVVQIYLIISEVCSGNKLRWKENIHWQLWTKQQA